MTKANVLGIFLGVLLATGSSSGGAAGANTMHGVWASEGYGRVLEIEEDHINIFEVTDVSCMLGESASLDEYLASVNRINLSEEDKFSLYQEGGITRYEFSKLDELPASCEAAKEARLDPDPEHNFEVFWHSFNENYAFFDTHGVDWHAVYAKYRPLITAETSNDRLYDILAEIIALLDDRHVVLQGDGLPRRYSGHPGTLMKLLKKKMGGGLEPSREELAAAAKSIVAKAYLTSSRNEAVGGQFVWGWAADSIGYFSIDSMSGYLDEDKATLRDSHRLVDQVMDQVIADLRGAKGIIVDARWNDGGYDSNALHIAGHFTNQQLLAFTKRARNGNTLMPEQEIFIPWHAAERFDGPVVFLCGRDTLSAAEIFSLAMMAIPNATSLGEPTVGALSDTLVVKLPNGWRVSLSNEVYKAIDGIVYEGVGIPVDIYLQPQSDATLESYVKFGMNEAISLLQ